MEESKVTRTGLFTSCILFSLSPTPQPPRRRWEAEGDLGGGGRNGRRWDHLCAPLLFVQALKTNFLLAVSLHQSDS